MQIGLWRATLHHLCALLTMHVPANPQGMAAAGVHGPDAFSFPQVSGAASLLGRALHLVTSERCCSHLLGD